MFEPIPFKGITIEISALILGKVADTMSRAVTTRIVHYLKGAFIDYQLFVDLLLYLYGFKCKSSDCLHS
jgi:hypothetical protein